MTAVRNYLGLARRAGKVVSGEAQVEGNLKRGKGNLLIIAVDSAGAQRKYVQWATGQNVPVIIDGTKEELGLTLGTSPRAAVLVTDEGFSRAILKARG